MEPIKVVFWDLDGTLWAGTLDEDADESTIPAEMAQSAIIDLDNRGILNSIVSQAAQESARARLQQYNLWDYFVSPNFNVVSKAQAISSALSMLNILPQNAALIDDLPFYRAEVSQLIPGIAVYAPEALSELLSSPRTAPTGALGSDRRKLYKDEEQRVSALARFNGNRGDFLRSCDMVLRCGIAKADEVNRVDELFRRAHRMSSLNTSDLHIGESGNTITAFGHLRDRFGDYGIIAGARLALSEDTCYAVNLAISCRVQGRGIVEGFLFWLNRECRNGGKHFIVPVSITSDVNKPLRTTLRFMGFGPRNGSADGLEYLELIRAGRLLLPEWIDLAGDIIEWTR